MTCWSEQRRRSSVGFTLRDRARAAPRGHRFAARGWRGTAHWISYTRYPLCPIEIDIALFVKDPEVDALAEELASLKRTTKTEAVRQALRGELDREKDKLDLVAQSLAFAQSLRERAGPNPRPVDKAFRDGLYGEP